MKEPSELDTLLGHRFSHPELLMQALTHGSVRHEQQTGDVDKLPRVEDNERLEFLGDAIVGMVVAAMLYKRYPELNEGELTRIRAALVSRKHLGMVGTKLELGSYLRLGAAEERNGGRKKTVLLANCMEALIGALYLEGGLDAATAFVERTVTQAYVEGLRSDLRENRAIGDYKTALQELLQARRAGQPEYVVEAESGPDHRKRFLVEVRVAHGPHKGNARGEGSTKKKAEQEAARGLYELLLARSPAVSAPTRLRLDAEPEPLLRPAADSPAGEPPHTEESQPGGGASIYTGESGAVPYKHSDQPAGADAKPRLHAPAAAGDRPLASSGRQQEARGVTRTGRSRPAGANAANMPVKSSGKKHL